MKNYYDILEVSPNASEEVVKMAYKALVKKYHPDVMGEAGNNKIKEINEAYEVLINPEKRRRYDIINGNINEKEQDAEDVNINNYTQANYSYTQTEENVDKQVFNSDSLNQNNTTLVINHKWISLFVLFLFVLSIHSIVSTISRLESNMNLYPEVNNSGVNISTPDINISNNNVQNVVVNAKTFKLGSPQEYVQEVMGVPDRIDDYSYFSYWYYGSSEIKFDENDKVCGWDNNGNLKVNQGKQATNNTFYLGSTQSQVINAMGTPNKIDDYSYFSYWYYGSSEIKFDENDKVCGWDNNGNLNIAQTQKVANSTFKLGSTKEQVANAMGIPDGIDDYSYFSYWYYGSSEIKFDENDKVCGWDNGSIPLTIGY